MNEGYLQQSFRPFYKLLLQSFSKYLGILTDLVLFIYTKPVFVYKFGNSLKLAGKHSVVCCTGRSDHLWGIYPRIWLAMT